MARKKINKPASGPEAANNASASVDELLLAALEKGGETLHTGRYLVTFKEANSEEGLKHLKAMGLRMTNARDFDNQAVSLESIGDADGLIFPEMGVALLS